MSELPIAQERAGHVGDAAPAMMVDEFTGRTLTGFARLLFAISAIVVTCLSLNQLLNLQLFAGIVFIENRYLYLLTALLLSADLSRLPRDPKSVVRQSPLVRLAAGVRSRLALLIWFARQAERILPNRAGNTAPATCKALSPASLWLLILEGCAGPADDRDDDDRRCHVALSGGRGANSQSPSQDTPNR